MAEQVAVNDKVVGSNPTGGAIHFLLKLIAFYFLTNYYYHCS